MEKGKDPQIQFPEIALELAIRFETDQEMRKRVKEGQEWGVGVDEENTLWLKNVIKKIGWPTISKVGKKGMSDAWLLVQHADKDPEFQAYCLELMRSESAKEVRQDLIAYLEDRVRVNTGRKQFYGTQFTINANGEYVPQPIESVKDLEERRAGIGLEPFTEYKTRMEERNREFGKNERKKNVDFN